MRIALDTNVLSELAKPECDPHVLEWSSGFRSEEFFLPSPCWAELQRGIQLLPAGRRRAGITRALDSLLEAIGGVLPFGRPEAELYGELMAQPGRPRPTMDAMIAAICKAADLPLATRNVRDFDGCGISLVDPWRATRG